LVIKKIATLKVLIVLQKLRWVKNGINWWVTLQYWGAGHYFLILKGHHLVFFMKHFAAI
jgi:hypothetical protein